MKKAKKKKKRGLTPFGQKVMTEVIRQNIQLVDLAKDVGISKQYLTHIIRGYRTKSKYCLPIAKRLGI